MGGGKSETTPFASLFPSVISPNGGYMATGKSPSTGPWIPAFAGMTMGETLVVKITRFLKAAGAWSPERINAHHQRWGKNSYDLTLELVRPAQAATSSS